MELGKLESLHFDEAASVLQRASDFVATKLKLGEAAGATLLAALKSKLLSCTKDSSYSTDARVLRGRASLAKLIGRATKAQDQES